MSGLLGSKTMLCTMERANSLSRSCVGFLLLYTLMKLRSFKCGCSKGMVSFSCLRSAARSLTFFLLNECVFLGWDYQAGPKILIRLGLQFRIDFGLSVPILLETLRIFLCWLVDGLSQEEGIRASSNFFSALLLNVSSSLRTWRFLIR